MNSQTERYAFLRRALQANGIFSALSGIIIILADNSIASIIGLPEQVSLIGLGISLLLFAASLLWVASREEIKPAAAWAAVILDIGWVAGSAALISASVLSAPGNLAVAAVAAIVLLFALLQFLGIRKLRGQTAG